MKRFFPVLIIAFLFSGTLSAQSVKLIKELENKHNALQKEITETEKLLLTTGESVSSQLNTLNALAGQIEARRRYISTITGDISAIDKELKKLNGELQHLQNNLLIKKKNYEASVQYLYKNKTIEERLLFLLSAENPGQIYRRLRYVREYADFQRSQGEEIIHKQKEIEKKTAELTQTRETKTSLLDKREQEKYKLEKEEQGKRNLLSNLQKKQKNLQAEITKKKREAGRLNTQIDKLVFEEMERVRKRAEIEARNSSISSKDKGQLNLDKTDRTISQLFAGQRGKLSMPITGTSMIISRYGEYGVPGLKNVKLDNKGIDIQSQPGAEACAIYDGKVAAIFSLNGLLNVLIRHGNYISVYCNLSTTTVAQGQNVKEKQTIGKIFSDPSDNRRTVLHFQLRVEKEKLNPELWLMQR